MEALFLARTIFCCGDRLSTILITGGSGFLGTHLVKKLVGDGKKVRIFDRSPPQEKFNDEKVEVALGDVTDFGALLKACEGVDIVFHLAALLPAQGRRHGVPGEMYKANLEGTKRVLEASFRSGVKKFVHMSSSSVYGIPEKIPCNEDSKKNPIGEYGRSKLEAEIACMEYYQKGLDVTILIPMTMVGPGMTGILRVLFDWIRRGKRIYFIGSGNNRIQMLSVHDMVKVCQLVGRKNVASGEILNVGSENVPTVNDQIHAIIEYAKSKSKIIHLNSSLVKSTLRFLSSLRISPLDRRTFLLSDHDWILDISKAKRLLGWSPRYNNIEMSIEAYDWYVQNYSKARYREDMILRLLRYLS